MENLMKARIEERLSALHMNAFEAEEKAGLTRGYIYELLIGKKASIRPNKLPAIASALECTPEYLTGHSSSPNANTNGEPPLWAQGDVPVAGIIEEGALRKPEQIKLSVQSDRRYAVAAQRAFLVRGDNWKNEGIFDGSILLVATDLPPRTGDLVVIMRRREGAEEREITLRKIESAHEALASRADEAPTEVIGVVTMQMRSF